MKLGANYGKFVLVPEGDQHLKIVAVRIVPKAKPKTIEVDLLHKNGGKITQKYNLTGEQKNVDAAVYYFTMLYVHATGNKPIEFDTSTIGAELEGKYIKGTVVHTLGSRANEKTGEFPTFANFKKAIDTGKAWDVVEALKTPSVVVVEDDLEDLDDDDLDDLDELDDEDDLPE